MKNSAVKNERPDISEAIWPKDIPNMVKNLKDNGVSEFTISNGTCGIAELLAIFENNGAFLQGLTRIKTGWQNFDTNEDETKPVFLMKII